MKRSLKLMSVLLTAVLLVTQFAACNNSPPPAVVPAAVTGVAIKGAGKVAFTGESYQLSAEVTVTGDAAKTVTWSSGDTEIATVGTDGKVMPLKAGNVIIKAASSFDTSKEDSVELVIAKSGTPINGSFDRDTLNWGIYPANATYELSGEHVYDGKKAYKVTTDNTNKYIPVWHEVTVGTGDYELRAGDYVKVEAMIYKEAESDLKARVFLVEDPHGINTARGQLDYTSGIAAGEWIKITSGTVKITNVPIFTVKFEFDGIGELFIDSVHIVPSQSNDVSLSALTIGGTQLDVYSDSVNVYSVPIGDAGLPLVAATASVNDTTVVITQATESNPSASVAITAADGTTRTVTINFVNANYTDLTDIKISGTSIPEFRVNRTEYYRLLDKGTTAAPAVTFTKYDVNAAAVYEAPQSLPGYGNITVTKGEEVTEYKIYFDVISESRLMVSADDTTFENGMKNWGKHLADISTDESHSGLHSLKAPANGGEAWGGFGFGTHESGYPAKGDSLTVGVWVYIVPNVDLSGTVKIRLLEKENNLEAAVKEVNATEIAAGNWVYIETGASSVISDTPSYLQIILLNNTNTVVYFDDVTINLTTAPVPPTEGPINLSALDLGFESATLLADNNWGGAVLSTEQAHSGTGSAKIDGGQYAGFLYRIGLAANGLAAGDKVKFGAWIYLDNGTETKNVMVKINSITSDPLNDGDYATHSMLGNDAETGRWLYIETSIVTLGADWTGIAIVIGNDVGASVFYADDLILTKVIQN